MPPRRPEATDPLARVQALSRAARVAVPARLPLRPAPLLKVEVFRDLSGDEGTERGAITTGTTTHAPGQR